MAVITDPSGIASALAELGLTEEILAEAIRRGEQSRNSTTPHHPRSAGGSYSYFETTTALRVLLAPLGGEPLFIDGFERCICPGGRDEIAVMTGDHFTGDPDRDPQPKYLRPRVVAQDVVARSQVTMFRREEMGVRPARRLWFLLMRRDGDNAKAELSLPGAITESGRVNVWEKRILLRPIAVGSAPVTSDTEETEAIDIALTPRAD